MLKELIGVRGRSPDFLMSCLLLEAPWASHGSAVALDPHLTQPPIGAIAFIMMNLLT